MEELFSDVSQSTQDKTQIQTEVKNTPNKDFILERQYNSMKKMPAKPHKFNLNQFVKQARLEQQNLFQSSNSNNDECQQNCILATSMSNFKQQNLFQQSEDIPQTKQMQQILPLPQSFFFQGQLKTEQQTFKEKLNQVKNNITLPQPLQKQQNQQKEDLLIHSDSESPTTTKKIIDENIKKFQSLKHSTTVANISDEDDNTNYNNNNNNNQGEETINNGEEGTYQGLKLSDHNVERKIVKSKTVQFSQPQQLFKQKNENRILRNEQQSKVKQNLQNNNNYNNNEDDGIYIKNKQEDEDGAVQKNNIANNSGLNNQTEKSKLKANKIFSKYEVNFKLLEKYAEIHEVKKFEDVEKEVLRESEKSEKQQQKLVLQKQQYESEQEKIKLQVIKQQKKKDVNHIQSSKSYQISRRQSNVDEFENKKNNKDLNQSQSQKIQKKIQKKLQSFNNSIIDHSNNNIAKINNNEEDDYQLFVKLEQQINNESNLVQTSQFDNQSHQYQRDSTVNNESEQLHLSNLQASNQFEFSQNEGSCHLHDSNQLDNISSLKQQENISKFKFQNSSSLNQELEEEKEKKKKDKVEEIKKETSIQSQQQNQRLPKQQQQLQQITSPAKNQKIKQQNSSKLKTQKIIPKKQKTLNFSVNSSSFQQQQQPSSQLKKNKKLDTSQQYQSAKQYQQQSYNLNENGSDNNSYQVQRNNQKFKTEKIDILTQRERKKNTDEKKQNFQRSLTHEYKEDLRGENIIQPSTSSYFQFKSQYLPPPVDGEQLNKLLQLNSTKNSSSKQDTPIHDKNKSQQQQLQQPEKSSLRNSLKNTPQGQRMSTKMQNIQTKDEEFQQDSSQNFLNSLSKQPKSVRFQNDNIGFEDIQDVDTARYDQTQTQQYSNSIRIKKSNTVFNISNSKQQVVTKSDMRKPTGQSNKLDFKDMKIQQKQINQLKTSKSQIFIKEDNNQEQLAEVKFQQNMVQVQQSLQQQQMTDKKYQNLDKLLSQFTQQSSSNTTNNNNKNNIFFNQQQQKQ